MTRHLPLLAALGLALGLGLTLGLGLGLGGCYAPELRDCTVSCADSDACAGDQVCGPQGFCVAEGTVCTAGAPELGDAGVAATVMLRVKIEGVGQVRVDGIGTCTRDEDQPGDCAWAVPRAMALSLQAIELDDDEFERWTTTPCDQQGATCRFTPAAAITIGVRFK